VHRRLLSSIDGVHFNRVTALALCGLLQTACGAPDSEPDRARLYAPIVNGELSDEAEAGVVSLGPTPEGSGGQACSGTLVAPNLVMTAVHCVAYYTGGRFRCEADGSLNSTNPGDGELGALTKPEEVAIYTGVVPGAEPAAIGARLFGTGTSDICRNDFAIVQLDRDLDLPLATLRMDRSIRRGQKMKVVGYGITEAAQSDVSRRRRTDVTVIDVAPETGTGSTAPRTFVLDEGACQGDSGGPAFSEETGALVGVYSLAVGSTCTTQGVRNVYTKLSPFKSLIDQAFAAAGYEPLLEPPDPNEPDPEPPDPMDDPFAGSGSRSSGCSATGLPVTSSAAFAALAGLLLAVTGRRRRERSLR
jgi:uncharacterized protein (TIGR03382 family)